MSSTKNAKPKAKIDPDKKTEADYMKENRRLHQELEDAKKENLFWVNHFFYVILRPLTGRHSTLTVA
ncbi:hypothetical protein [Candidatus Weimeria sp. HCP3S3_B5]|uniref:hypothetical protein n=1 Tax=Candidatus Weimeria sp. HCP3S3_B5 TaxID=3438871 RepID=UPI003F8C596F